MTNGKDLFDKNIEGNLSKSSLKKAAKKESRLKDLIVDQLPFLTEFYFGKYQQKQDQRDKFRRDLLRLLGSEPYFIEPLEKIVSKAVKKKRLKELPKGLAAMLMDNVDEVRRVYREQIEKNTPKNNDGGNKNNYTISKDQLSKLELMKDLTEQLVDRTVRLCEAINVPVAKKLAKELDIEMKYAAQIAANYVPAELLTPNNVRRYVYRLNLALYAIQKDGVEANAEDEGRWVNNIGVNLANADVIKTIYEIMFEGIDRKTMISMMAGIMLERRGAAFDKFTAPQLQLYKEIGNLVLDVLEGDIAYINFTGKKLSHKKAKKALTITKKELKTFMKIFSDERSRDAMKHNDSPRRISFSSLDEGEYPRVTSAFKSRNKDYFNELLDVPERNTSNNKNHNNNRNNNKGNDKRRDDDRNDRNNNRGRNRR